MVAAERATVLLPPVSLQWQEICNFKQVTQFRVQWRMNKGQERRGLLKTPMEVSFSVGINDSFPGLSR